MCSWNFRKLYTTFWFCKAIDYRYFSNNFELFLSHVEFVMKSIFYVKILIRDFLFKNMAKKFKGKKLVCPICEFQADKFGSSPNGERQNVKCPRCRSLERHRAQWLFGLSKINYNKNTTILHFSPEFCYSRVFMRKTPNYYTAQYTKSMLSDYTLDIQNTGLRPNMFDIIICNHILEHVNNDYLAISELYRLLKPNGFAFIQVPMDCNLKNTYEDSSVKDPIEREKLFGQSDHLRLYGWDFEKRLENSGFKVETIQFWKLLSSEEIDKYALHENEPVFVCQKL